jgi:tocopherol cyclase
MNKYSFIPHKKNYFEGWYFKHQNGKKIAAFIPGICKDEDGKSYAFIQLLFNHKSYNINYALTDCKIDKKKFSIRIGKNIFSRKGVHLDIENDEIIIKGTLLYGQFQPIGYSIMGPFRYLPGMECKHEIISMYHNVKGELLLDGELMTFAGGLGYIEKDWGNSFPKSYTWLHCNQFEGDEKGSLIVSIAAIPYHGIKFKGCICAISYNGQIYRLATYLGVKILVSNEHRIYLKQGKYLLKILMNSNAKKNVSENNLYTDNSFSHELYAPDMGKMSRAIMENHMCYARFLFYENNRIIFDLTSKEVSMEYVE